MKRYLSGFMVILLAVILASCEVPTATRQAVNEALCATISGGDPASLTLATGSFTFDPVDGTALDVIAVGTGSGIASPEGTVTPSGNLRFFGDGVNLTEPVTVPFTGTDRAVSVTYLREGDVALKWCRVVE